MKFTTDRPTDSGWYWYESNSGERAICYVECFRDPSSDNVRFIGTADDKKLDELHGKIFVRWKGPLRP